MFYVWYCFDDTMASALGNPAIGNTGWMGFWCLTILHLALLPFFAVHRDALVIVFRNWLRQFTTSQLYVRAILGAHILLGIAVAQSVFH